MSLIYRLIVYKRVDLWFNGIKSAGCAERREGGARSEEDELLSHVSFDSLGLDSEHVESNGL